MILIFSELSKKRPMKKRLFYLVCALVLTSCGVQKNVYKDITPKALSSGVYFDMPLADFKDLKSLSDDAFTDDEFRTVYVEENLQGDVSDIVYYFDKDGDAPLYEMIFIYRDTLVRDAEAAELLGAPNEGAEWNLKRSPYDIKAWTFKSKLILTALIPLTEWAEEQ